MKYIPSRTVAKYDDWCCVCWKEIPKNTCVCKMFNHRSHKECEPEMVEKYINSTLRGRRPRAEKSV